MASLTSKLHLRLWNCQLSFGFREAIFPFSRPNNSDQLVLSKNKLFQLLWHLQIFGSILILVFNWTKWIHCLGGGGCSFGKTTALAIASLFFARGSVYQVQLLVARRELMWFFNNVSKFYRDAGKASSITNYCAKRYNLL